MPLAADMRRIVAAGRARLAQAPRDVLTAVSVDLVQHTPIDRGYLIEAWHASAQPAVPAEPDKSGAGSIARLTAAAQALPLGGTFLVTNAMPYAPLVEYGTARMAPRAYMRGTLSRAPALTAVVLANGGTSGEP